jgi:hypothetical protein
MQMANVFRALGWRKRRRGEGPERSTGDDGRKHRVYIRGPKAASRMGALVQLPTQAIRIEDFAI